MAISLPPPVNLASILETGQYSDLTIRCGAKDFPVHKAIVCIQSKVLQAAIGEGFEAGTTGIINLSGHQPEHVENMLQFLYSSTYRSSNVALHVEMYAMGAKFDLPRLCQFAKDRFKANVPTPTMHASVDDLRYGSLIPVIPRIYETTPDSNKGLRTIAVWNVRKDFECYSSRPDLKGKFREILQSTWSFTEDLLQDFAARPLIGRCSSCGPAQALKATKKSCAACGLQC